MKKQHVLSVLAEGSEQCSVANLVPCARPRTSTRGVVATGYSAEPGAE